MYVAEYYVVESVSVKYVFYKGLDGSTQKFTEEELDSEQIDTLKATGFKRIKKREIKTNKIHKYINIYYYIYLFINKFHFLLKKKMKIKYHTVLI